MNEQIIKELSFDDVVGRADFKTALMLFRDRIPKTVTDKFTVFQWVAVFDSPFPGEKMKKLAWEAIKEAKLTFERSRRIFKERYRNAKIKAQMLDNMCLLANNAEEIVYCIDYLDDNDPRRPGLLTKLSKVNEPFPVLAGIFHSINNRKTDLQDAVFRVMEKTEASFEQWQDFNRGFGRSTRYLTERFKAMKERADTFDKKRQTYISFKGRKSLVSEIAPEISVLLQDLINTAENIRHLRWIYSETKSNEVKAKILTAPGTFDDFLSVNQTTVEDWLVELSLREMRKLAKSFGHWATLWCRESLEKKKEEAASNMIELANDLSEAKLAFHRALGTALEKKAQEKLRQIVSAL